MRWLATLVSLSSVFVMVSCLSAARRSSGAVGCRADEITVTNESVGLIGDHTWTAECHGRTYYCSMNSGEGGSQVSCTPAADDADSARKTAASPAPATTAAPPSESAQEPPEVNQEPPKKAAGFDFGWSEKQIAEQCSSVGGTFTPGGERSHCSKTAAPVGFEGQTALGFCGDGLCAVDVTGNWPGKDQKALTELFTKLVRALYAKYGQSRELKIPNGTCREHVASCLRNGSAEMKARWEWASGEKLTLQVKTADEGFVLGLHYRVPGAIKEPEVEGL